ncbi:MAG: chemotaxis protein CheB, partial [Pseudomonadota bacterium]
MLDSDDTNVVGVGRDQFIVGVGASAGGLEAILDMFRYLPVKAPASYVIVQHLSPTNRSLLSQLVDRETHLKVTELADGVSPAANVVYTTPPNRHVIYKNGRLRLMDATSAELSPKPSIDRFFLSIAEEIGEKAVGVVLSGTGRDGAVGVQAIRGGGGITIAQDDKSARYDGMPIAAMETGCVDLILTPMEIGSRLGRILDSPHNLGQFHADEDPEQPLAELLRIVLARTRVDFRRYKVATIWRRLEKRMVARGVGGPADNRAIFRTDPQQVDAWFSSFLVS